MITLISGLTPVGPITQPSWGPRDPQRPGWKPQAVRLNDAVSDVDLFKSFPIPLIPSTYYLADDVSLFLAY